MKIFHCSIILTFALSMFGTNAMAHDIEVKNDDGVTIYYNYFNEGKELEVVGAANYGDSIVIPEEVTYMNRPRKVTSIGDHAFAYYGPKHVTLPNSLIYIKGGAFIMSGLLSINLPNNLTYIGDGAFADCAFTTISIPNSVNTIEDNAFLSCDSLKVVSIGNRVSRIGDAAFSKCPIKKVIIMDISAWCNIEFGEYYANPTLIAHHIYSDENNEIVDLYIPNGVTSIKERVFSGCNKLKSVSLPNSVISIGDCAFENCKGITSITIPQNVSSIGHRAFEGCDFTTVTSQIENPKPIISKEGYYDYEGTFSLNTYNNATLYVPTGTIGKYKSTEGWKDFLYIEEGIENGVSHVRANAILIQTENGRISVSGADDGTIIGVYNTNGALSGTEVSRNGSAIVSTNLQVGSVAIVKIGDKSVKVVVK